MADSSALRIHRRQVPGGLSIVSVGGEIDLATAHLLHDSLSPHLSDPATTVLVCDLTQVEFLACSGLSILVDAHTTLAARGARLSVVAVAPAVLRPMTVTGLLGTLTVYPTLATALAQSTED